VGTTGKASTSECRHRAERKGVETAQPIHHDLILTSRRHFQIWSLSNVLAPYSSEGMLRSSCVAAFVIIRHLPRYLWYLSASFIFACYPPAAHRFVLNVATI
jgi:hypothetical protein